MRTALLLLLVLLAGRASAEDAAPPPEERVFLEYDGAPESVWLGQTVRVRLLVGLDRHFFRSRVVPVFARPMDYPARLVAPGLESLPRAEADPAARRRSLAVNDDVISLPQLEDRDVGGRPFTVLVLERSIRPDRAGTLVIPAPRLEFTHASDFEENFVNGPRPVDPKEESVEGPPLEIEVREPPAEGRPAYFSGAVGRFTVSARAEPRAVAAGESVKVRIEIRGEGNLAGFDTPRLPDLPGFHELGAIDDRGAPVRTVVYDLVPLDSKVAEVPPLPLAYFDPGPPAHYATAFTRALSIEVRTDPAGAAPAPARGPGRPRSLLLPMALAAFAILAIGALVIVLALRLGRGRVEDPAAARAAEAASAFRAGTEDRANAFAEYLAARLGCPAAAVIGPDLGARLRAAGVPEDLAARAAARLETFVAARYGSGETTADADGDHALLEELDAAFGDRA